MGGSENGLSASTNLSTIVVSTCIRPDHLLVNDQFMEVVEL